MSKETRVIEERNIWEENIEGVRNKMTKGNVWDKQKKSIDFIGEKIKENRLLNQYGNKIITNI